MDQVTSTECHDVNHVALTTLQRQLWVQSQVGTAASLAYNISINLRLQGRLDRRLLREAIEYVWGRHDAMRTTIDADGRFQTCHRQMKADAKLIDLSSVDSAQREGMLQQEIARNNEQAFDFQTGPLFRVRVYKCDQTSHLLMLTAHHIVSDGWSLVLILREIADYYKSAYSGGLAASAPPMQYGAFIAAEQRRAGEEGREESDKYWRNILQAPLPVMRLPADFQRPTVRSFRAGRMHRRLSASQTLKLREMARRGGSTLFMLLYGAFSVLLHRICKQDDLIIGTPSAGRFADGSDTVVGYCGSLLPIRNRYDGSRSFAEHMREVRRSLLDAYDHQEVSFAELIGELPLSRAANRSALVDAIFNLEPPVPMPSIPGLALTVEPQATPYSSYDFFFNVSEINDELSLDLDFNRDILRPETVDSMLSAYLALLDDAFHNPDKSLARLDLIGDEGREMRDLLNNTTTLAAPANLIHESIEANAREMPDITALVFGDLCISYGALNARANQLAHRLRQCGVGPEVRVGLCVERSIEQFVALLAIHKAGGAYVPLDPDYPVERLQYCVEDAGIRLLLTQQTTRKLLQIDGVPVFGIDDSAELDACPTDDLSPTVTSSNLAYIIYTSGSTGHPKGVAVTHASVVNLMMAMNDRPGLSRDDRLLGITTFAFDMSVVELFLPLTNAATLVVAPRGAVFSGDAFIAHMLDQQVNVLQATPAAWRLFLGKGDRGRLGVKMLCGGEALSAALCQQLLEHGSEVWNMYGPTETTVWSSCQRCDATGKHDISSGNLPVGKPLANTFFYLLDEQLQPVPSGFPGILYIGGSGLARGYWGKPELTAERFVPDPFVPGPGARMYDTGDLARYLSDGSIDIIGRTDNQVKVRGFRIELGEIEAVFQSHPDVSHAAVVVSRDKRGDNRLHAYYEADNAVDRTELRTYLQRILPPYMVPGSISELASLPLTSTGKIDRRALADSGHQQAVSETCHVAPRNSLEASMCEAWRELLEVPLVGIDDDFFVLGGHSLLAAELVSRVRDSMSVPVTLAGILSNPTVRQLVQSVNQRKDEAVIPEEELPQVTPDPDHQFEPFPLTDIQQAYWIGRSPSLELGNTPAFNYSEATLDHCDPSALEHAWNILMLRHDMLRMCVNDQGAQYIKPDWPHVSIPFQDFSVLDDAARSAALLEVREQMTNRDSSEAIWSEVRLSKLHENSFVIHLYLDMMAFDGASLHILYRELAALLRDPSRELPPLGVSFRDYVLTEDKLRETQAYKRAREYWMSRIESLPPAPQLPLACPPSMISKPKFRRWSEELASARWKALKTSALHRGITPSVLALTAFCEVLGHWTGQRRFTINLTLFNRLALHPEINDVIGDFTSLNLLEIDQSRAMTFHDRARANQHQLWSDLEHRHFGGVRVIRELNRRRGSGPAAAMPVVFTSDLSIEQRAATDRLEQQISDQRIGISNTPQTWMDVAVMESEDALVILMDAVEALFPAGLLDDMFSAYCGLLERLADDELAWDESHLLTLPEPQAVVRESVNATSAALPEGLLHAGFLDQASRQPEALAVWTSGRCLSYGQLRHLARHYAHQLRSSGDVSNRLVGVVMRKGWEQLVAVLAIEEAGAAYLPIDAELPEARIVQLLALGEVGHVLTQAGMEADINWPEGVFCWSVETAALEEPEPAALVPLQAPDALAYVIFTSGSTGQPKGVMIDHRGARNTIESINRLFDVGADDRVLALSSLSFDLSVYDIFGLLSAGGAVVIPDAALEKDPAHWSQLLEAGQVSVWNTVPALMQLLVEYHEQQGLALPPTLREVLLSGDWIPVTLPDRIRALGPQVRVTSLGGATEASIWSIHYPVAEVDSDWKSIPYGRPLANQSYHVLDADLRACPDWVVGDLYIGGVGLAQGYWRDEARTATSFIVHPESAERLYRTGDKGRYHPDGDIEFLGREDGQVKIQGYRVELGEIEVALGRQPGVRESVVLAVGAGTGPKRLVGYVVMASPEGKQATLQDPVERTLFKLGRPGLRRVDGAGHALARAGLPLGHVCEPGVWREQAPSLESLGCWLDALSAHPVAGSVLPKYHYPSSGSLNPIQVYLEVGPEAQDGLESGSYYYDPVEHRLQRVADWHGSRPGVMLHLVAAMQAVSPLYGESAEILCDLEAGYVAELLRMTAPVQGIGLRLLSSESGLETRLALASGHCVQLSLAVGGTAVQEASLGLGMLARQSYREFAPRALSEEQLQALLGSVQVVPGLDWYVHIKPDGVVGREAGYYGLDAASGRCELLHAETALPAARYGGGNAEIFRMSRVAIYALGAAGRAQLQGAGSQGQRLSTVGVKAGVGVCPIGGFDATGLHERLGVDASVEVVHSWLAGPIDADQSERWEQESTPVMDAGERCRQGLQEELPGYMVPGVVMVLERMPLTGNGKVDRQALPEPLQRAREQSHEAPRTAMEKQLAEVWSEVLGQDRIGRNDQFFEIGGDSVMLIRTRMLIEKALARKIDIVDLFKYPTIAGLAGHLISQSATDASRSQHTRKQADRQKDAARRARSRARERATGVHN